jgi:hypothetical protein
MKVWRRRFRNSHDFAIDDFAIPLFAPSRTDKGKIIDGKIMEGRGGFAIASRIPNRMEATPQRAESLLRISDFGFLSDFGFRVSDLMQQFLMPPAAEIR